MALNVTMTEGDMEVQIKYICRQNMAQMITDGSHTAADYPELKGGLIAFEKVLLTMISQFATDEGTVGVAAQGTLTMPDTVSEDDTCTIGAITYTFKDSINYDPSADTSTAIQVDIGASTEETQANLVARVNGVGFVDFNSLVSMSDFSTNVSTLTARSTGTAGNSIATTETFTELANVFNGTTLGTTTTGVTAVPNASIAAISTAPAIESWVELREFAAAAFAVIDGVINP